MKKLILAICLALPLEAALSSGTTWEVRQAGSDTNGGGFLTGSSGTDMSQFNNKNAGSCTSCQSATLNISTTDVVAVSSTTLTSATMNGSAAMVGNIIHLNGGTGSLAASWYTIATFVSNTAGVTTFTVDRAVATGTGIAMNVGGALGTLAGLNAAMSVTSNITQTGWVKADSAYSISSGVTFNLTAPTKGTSTNINGYTAARGDNGQPTFNATSGGFTMVTISNNNNLSDLTFRNFILNCNAQSTCSGLIFLANGNAAANVKVVGATGGYAFNLASALTMQGRNLWSSGYTGTSEAFVIGSNQTGSASFCIFCAGTGGTGLAFQINPSGICLYCIAANNTGSNTDGFQVACITASSAFLNNLISYKNGRDGIRFTGDGCAGNMLLTVLNSVLYGNTGFGFNNTGTTGTSTSYSVLEDYNGLGSNMAGATNNQAQGSHDVALSGDPFVNGASLNFALNGTAGAGAALKAAGFPGALQTGGTGFLDIGPLQSQVTGNGAKAFGFVGP